MLWFSFFVRSPKEKNTHRQRARPRFPREHSNSFDESDTWNFLDSSTLVPPPYLSLRFSMNLSLLFSLFSSNASSLPLILSISSTDRFLAMRILDLIAAYFADFSSVKLHFFLLEFLSCKGKPRSGTASGLSLFLKGNPSSSC